MILLNQNDAEEIAAEEESYEGWNNDSWNANPVEEDKKDEGWENDSWSTGAEPDASTTKEEEDTWGGGWENDGGWSTNEKTGRIL